MSAVDARFAGGPIIVDRDNSVLHVDAGLRDNDQEYLAQYLEFMQAANRAKRTIKTHISTLRAFAQRQGVHLAEAQVSHLRRDLAREAISPASKARYRTIFMEFFGFLHAEGVRLDNPAIRLPVIKVPPASPRPYTQEQIDRMLAAGAYRRTRAMILLAAYQGLRVSEIARVHTDDIDVSSGTIKVRGKGGRTDYLPLHSTIRELVPTMNSGWWFPARKGRDGHISGTAVSTLLTRARDRAGIVDKRLTGHSLRHTFATELVRGGANIAAVKELMRHSSLQTTQRYVQVLDEDRREAIAILPERQIPTRSGRRRDETPTGCVTGTTE